VVDPAAQNIPGSPWDVLQDGQSTFPVLPQIDPPRGSSVRFSKKRAASTDGKTKCIYW